MWSFAKFLRLIVCFLLAFLTFQSGGDSQNTRSSNRPATTRRTNGPATTRRQTTTQRINVQATTRRTNGPASTRRQTTTQRTNGPATTRRQTTTQRTNGPATTRRQTTTQRQTTTRQQTTTVPASHPSAKITVKPSVVCTTGYAAKVEAIYFLVTFNYTNIYSSFNVNQSTFSFYMYNDTTNERTIYTNHNVVKECIEKKQPGCSVKNTTVNHKFEMTTTPDAELGSQYISGMWEIPLFGTRVRRFIHTNVVELGPISSYNRHTLTVAFNITNETRIYKLQQGKKRVVLGSNTVQPMLLTFCALDGQPIDEDIKFQTCDGEVLFIEPEGNPPYCYDFHDYWDGEDCTVMVRYNTPESVCRTATFLKARILTETSFWTAMEYIYSGEFDEFF